MVTLALLRETFTQMGTKIYGGVSQGYFPGTKRLKQLLKQRTRTKSKRRIKMRTPGHIKAGWQKPQSLTGTGFRGYSK